MLSKPDWQFFTSSQFLSATAISNQVPCQYRMTSVPLHIISSITRAARYLCAAADLPLWLDSADALRHSPWFYREFRDWLSLLIMQLVWPVPGRRLKGPRRPSQKWPRGKGTGAVFELPWGWGGRTPQFFLAQNSCPCVIPRGQFQPPPRRHSPYMPKTRMIQSADDVPKTISNSKHCSC